MTKTSLCPEFLHDNIYLPCGSAKAQTTPDLMLKERSTIYVGLKASTKRVTNLESPLMFVIVSIHHCV